MKLINELGNKYGMWTVIERAPNTRHGQGAWLCQCECGNKKIVSHINLRSGGSTNCGCLHILPRGVAACNHVVFQTKRSAIERGYEFAISRRYLKFLHKKNCFYCGNPPSTETKPSAARYNGEYLYNGIDRIDNRKGYIEENVISCCSKCNFAKGTMDGAEFIELANKIAKHQAEKARS